VVAKLEKLQAIRNLRDIIAASDAVMVARGDLGVEMALGEVPAIQKDIINRANRAGVPVITATEMLESMVTSNRPTRAEASDVANAIWDGTDAVMLSQETSTGAHPVEAVRAMSRICLAAENHPAYLRERPVWKEDSLSSAIAHASAQVATEVNARYIIAFTESGATALRVSKSRPPVPVIAASPYGAVLRRTALYAGVIPLEVGMGKDTDDMIDKAVKAAMAQGIVRNGDRVLYSRQKTQLQTASNPAARAAMHDVLASVVREGTARGARINVPAEGKTGTSQNHKDAWFIGFTNDIVVGVWVGNDDNSPTRGVTGGDLPARIWNEFVTQSAPVRAKLARASSRATALSAFEAGDAKRALSASVLRGVPVVQNTGMLEIQGRIVRLFGVEGIRGRAVREFRRYLANREVVCEPAGGGNDYRCRLDDQDLSRVVLFNGGGRASANASAELRALEQQARSGRVGIWGGRDEEDDQAYPYQLQR